MMQLPEFEQREETLLLSAQVEARHHDVPRPPWTKTHRLAGLNFYNYFKKAGKYYVGTEIPAAITQAHSRSHQTYYRAWAVRIFLERIKRQDPDPKRFDQLLGEHCGKMHRVREVLDRLYQLRHDTTLLVRLADIASQMHLVNTKKITTTCRQMAKQAVHIVEPLDLRDHLLDTIDEWRIEEEVDATYEDCLVAAANVVTVLERALERQEPYGGAVRGGRADE